MCVWRDRKIVWAYEGWNVIMPSCVGTVGSAPGCEKIENTGLGVFGSIFNKFRDHSLEV